MKHETRTEGDKVFLKLGAAEISFEKGVSVNEIVQGVEAFMAVALGVSAFELVRAVMEEFNKNG